MTQRLLIITPEYPPFVHGGIGKYVTDIVPRLSRDYQVHVLCIPSYSTKYTWGDPSKVERSERSIIIHDSEYVAEIGSKAPNTSKYREISAFLCEQFLDATGETLFDHLFLQHYTEIEVARLVSRRNPNATRTYFSHLPHPTKYSYFDREKRIRRHQELESLCLAWANKVVTPSRYSKRILAATYPISERRISVVPHGIASNGISAPAARAPWSFVSVGRFTEQKGWPALVDLASRLEQKNINQKWLVVGDGPLREHVTAMFLRKVPAARVEFRRSVEPSELLDLFSNFQFYVQTSEYESFGLAALEAISRGCLPILTDIPVFREVFGEHEAACFVRPTSRAELLNTLTTYAYADPSFVADVTRSFLAKCYSAQQHAESLSSLMKGE